MRTLRIFYKLLQKQKVARFQCIEPTQSVVSYASYVTGLKVINKDLFWRNEKVQTIPLRDALKSFKEFLNISSKPSVLVAHNVKFDAKHLLQAIIPHSMINDFISIISGFSDSEILLRKRFLDRKGKGQFKLSKLAEDLLPKKNTNNFHEALFDVEVLEELVCLYISTTDLLNNSKSYTELVNKIIGAQKVAEIALTLDVLNKVISDGMIKKMAQARITYNTLEDIYNQKGEIGLKQFLSEKSTDKKVRVTNRSKILNNIINYVKDHVN